MTRKSSHSPSNPADAAFTLSPERAAAGVIHRCSGLDPGRLAEMLEAQGGEAAAGDLKGVCRSLAAQGTTLERMFLHFFEQALEHPTGSEAYERLMRLSLRAQHQSARTAAILGRLVEVAPPADHEATPADSRAEDPPEPKGNRPERTDWLPETCGPDCASHLALKRLTRWANKSPVAIDMLTRKMNGEGSEVAA